MTTTELVHVRISGEASATDDQWWHALGIAWLTGGDVIDLSEVGAKRDVLRRWAAVNRFALCYSYHRGQSENAILVRKGFGTVLLERQRLLTPLRLKTARKAPLYALKVLIREHQTGVKVWDIASHAPAHGETRTGIVGGYVGRVIRSFYLGLSELNTGRNAKRIYSLDWNLDVRKRWVRAYLRALFPGIKPGWDFKNLPKRGTIGGHGRLIDGPRSDLEIVEHSRILKPMPGFKHRAVRTVYLLEGER